MIDWPENWEKLPWHDLSDEQQAELRKQAEFVKVYNDSLPPAPTLSQVEKKKAPGQPSFQLERERGYVT